jgi:luciferase-type oxidoreductase
MDEMNKAYKNLFGNKYLTVGILAPIESYRGSIPSMQNQDAMILSIEKLGFDALWLRDIPLHDPSFGDAGQMYDPFVYLGYLSCMTKKLSLGIASLILPFRHPIEVAKAINSVNNLSKGRLVLGVATGDRPIEYDAHNKGFEERGAVFQETLEYIQKLQNEDFPKISSKLGQIRYGDLLPKSRYGKVPFLVTGHSQQSIEWIAAHGDGWMYYPQGITYQKNRIANWRDALKKVKAQEQKPFVQSLYIDLDEDPYSKPIPIHLGYRLGRHYLLEHLSSLHSIGVDHVILNIKYGTRNEIDVLTEIGTYVLPKLKEM